MNKIYLSISTNKVQHNNFILINSTLNVSLLLWIQYIHRLINFHSRKKKKKISNFNQDYQDLNKITANIPCIEGDAAKQEKRIPILSSTILLCRSQSYQNLDRWSASNHRCSQLLSNWLQCRPRMERIFCFVTSKQRAQWAADRAERALDHRSHPPPPLPPGCADSGGEHSTQDAA